MVYTQHLKELGISSTRIKPLYEALDTLHTALSLMDGRNRNILAKVSLQGMLEDFEKKEGLTPVFKELNEMSEILRAPNHKLPLLLNVTSSLAKETLSKRLKGE